MSVTQKRYLIADKGGGAAILADRMSVRLGDLQGRSKSCPTVYLFFPYFRSTRYIYNQSCSQLVVVSLSMHAAVEDQRDDLQLEGKWQAVLGRQQYRRPCGDGHHAWAIRDVPARVQGQRQEPSAYQGTKWLLLAGTSNSSYILPIWGRMKISKLLFIMFHNSICR